MAEVCCSCFVSVTLRIFSRSAQKVCINKGAFAIQTFYARNKSGIYFTVSILIGFHMSALPLVSKAHLVEYNILVLFVTRLLRFILRHADPDLQTMMEQGVPPVDLSKISIFRGPMAKFQKKVVAY